MSKNFELPKIPLNDPGYIGVPWRVVNENYTLKASDNGTGIIHDSASTHTYTLDYNLVRYPDGFTVSIVNDTGAGVLTIAASTGLTMVLAGTGAAASRTLAANGAATLSIYKLVKIILNGTGLT